MENTLRISFAIISFLLPIIGVGIYVLYSPKRDAKLFGMIGMIGIFVYFCVGLGFI